MSDQPDIGQQIHDMLRELFPICRSITGNGVRETYGFCSGWCR